MRTQLSLEELRRVVFERAVRTYPRLRQGIIVVDGEPHWVPTSVDAFRVDAHVVPAGRTALRGRVGRSTTGAEVRDCDEAALKQYMTNLHSQRLTADKPLWQMQAGPRPTCATDNASATHVRTSSWSGSTANGVW